MLRWILLITFFISFAVIKTGQAKTFKNDYVSFELPNNWDCTREQSEWLCTNKFEAKKRKEAVIILTAKEQGPSDSLDAYEQHLRTPKTFLGKKNKMKSSRFINVNRRKIRGQEWIDSLHLESEVSSFYTRYAATVKNGLALLVTFSAHKNYYTKYSRAFSKAILSLNAVASPHLLRGKSGLRNRRGGLMDINLLGSSGLSLIEDNEELLDEGEITGFWNNDKNKAIASLGLILAALGLIIFLRKKKKKKK